MSEAKKAATKPAAKKVSKKVNGKPTGAEVAAAKVKPSKGKGGVESSGGSAAPAAKVSIPKKPDAAYGLATAAQVDKLAGSTPGPKDPPELIETEVAGTPYKLLACAGDPLKLTVAQRIEMAKRLVEVGPKLPHYVPQANPEQAAKGGAMGKGAAEETKKAEERAKLNTPTPIEEALKNPQTAKEKRKAQAKAIGESAARHGQAAQERKKAEAEEKAAKKGAGKPAAERSPKKAAGTGKSKGFGIGAFCEGLLLKGKTTEDILAAVKKEYPKAATKAASIAWYRNKLIVEGKLKRD